MKKIAVLGHGVVGSGVLEVLEMNRASLEKKLGAPLEVGYILDKRAFPHLPYAHKFVTDFEVIKNDPEVSVVVEVLGGVEPAFTFARESLERGKSVVTSNKELVAAKGDQLLALARAHGVNFFFEASVGGGIPIISPLHQCLDANRVEEVQGILNGTTNFILTKMIREGMSFADALALAQELGYAERDPAADVEGWDACRKICILASLAFGSRFVPEKVYTQGITKVTSRDVDYAAQWGGVIKLVGRARRLPQGAFGLMVSPVFVPRQSPLATVDDVYNAILVRGNAVGDVMFYGRGAGKLPTASAVVSDVLAALTAPGTVPSLWWEPEEPELLAPWQSLPVTAYLRVTGLEEPALAALVPGCRLLQSLEAGEAALITPCITEEELAALAKTLEAAGARVLGLVRLVGEDVQP